MRVAPAGPDLRTLMSQLGVGSTTWYGTVLAFPLLLLAGARLDVTRRGRLGAVVGTAAVISGLIALNSAVDYSFVYRGAARQPPLAAYLPILLRQDALPWIALAGIIAAIEAHRRSVRAEIERERLRAQVGEQRLLALTGQLRPHFLFNTLQAISTLIHRDPGAADEMLSKLAELLADVLRHRDQIFVPLGDELRYARTYLEIAKIRFADRLDFEITVPADAGDLAVPLFILQPLVENALAHGVGARMAGGRVEVSVSRRGERLRIEVRDDGPGMSSVAPEREGIGLSNTRERLRASFGADQTFVLEARRTGGIIARLEIPCRPWAELVPAS